MLVELFPTPRKHWFGKYLLLGEDSAVKNKIELKVIVNWRETADEPPPAWRRLWEKLLASKKGNHARQDGGNR